ncbi:MAG: winged helix-turn-helix transcriptional regulator [Candidatus Nitrosocosmicus sp.]|nr:winged helix-turn-helix transcriptional regulator [Candidatus Nitrosocosmicus sp.]
MIDNTDLAIMKELQRDSRMSSRKMSIVLGISYNTINNRIKKMIDQNIIDKFIVVLNHEIFGYKKLNLLISGIYLEGDNNSNIFRILSLAGHICEHYVCVGQIHSFGLLIKDNIEQKIEMLKKLIDGLTILGVQEPRKTGIRLEKLKETDFKIIYCLVKDPRANVGDMSKHAKVTTKTVKRRLDTLITKNLIAFSTTFKPKSIQGYILFHILLILRHEIELEILKEIRSDHHTHFFAEPIVQARIIFLNLYSQNVYELDKRYLQIINSSTEIEKSWLFIDKDILIYQDWIIDEINKINLI